MERPRLSVVILAGGEGRRIGQPKATLPFQGEPLLARVVRRLSALSDDLIIVTRNGELPVVLGPGVRCAGDALPGEGPLAALAGGLRIARESRAAVVSCDLPFVSPEVLTPLGGMLAGQRDAVVPVVGGRRQPLQAVYRTKAVARVAAQALAQGERSMNELMARLDVLEVPERQLAHVAGWRDSFTNVNTEAELRRARRKAGKAT